MSSLDEIDLTRINEAIAEARTTGDYRKLDELEDLLTAATAWHPQAYQTPPPGNWDWWVFSAGAGAGKTDTGAYWLDQHMQGPPCDKRVPGGHAALIAGPAFAEAIATCWNAPAGISAHNPDVQKVGRKDGTYAVWPNGAEAMFTGLYNEQDANMLRARAANKCAWWIDEGALARWLVLAVDLISMRCRLGKNPRGIVTSTPKPTAGWKHLLGQENTAVTNASSFDNAYLPEKVLARLRRFEGTTFGLQEIHGQLVEYFEGALWRRDDIEHDQVDEPPALNRIALAVDPSTWQPEFGDDPGTVAEGLETGIVAAGVGAENGEAYVLGDWSGRYGTDGAARVIIEVYHDLEKVAPTEVVIERNNDGGILKAVQILDPTVKFYRDPANPKRTGVHAAEGKRARAEPVSALYDAHLIHHVTRAVVPGGGHLALLVGQMVLWDPLENWSPDRLDALVWAVHALDVWEPPSEAGGVLSDIPRIQRTV